MEILHNAAAQVTMFCIFIENSGAVAPLFFLFVRQMSVKNIKLGKYKLPKPFVYRGFGSCSRGA